PDSASSLVSIGPDGLPERFLEAAGMGNAEQQPLEGPDQARITNSCLGCGSCVFLCRFGAIRRTAAVVSRGVAAATPWHVDPLSCTGCGTCARFCPSGAIAMAQATAGIMKTWLEPNSRRHAVASVMEPGQEVGIRLAGRLIREGKRGSAGHPAARIFLTGISVASSVAPMVCAESGLVILAASPVPGAETSIENAARLVSDAGRKTISVIMAADRHPGLSDRMEAQFRAHGIEPAGRIPYSAALHTDIRTAIGETAGASRAILQSIQS
ncbi:MAG TPA: 4Fe-4S binding protein, partial [Candidatus Ozemobacteraceae bacterium]|nr:4Fe-4S binding protein [Candidatus Ozemobacteraceae bacterium]